MRKGDSEGERGNCPLGSRDGENRKGPKGKKERFPSRTLLSALLLRSSTGRSGGKVRGEAGIVKLFEMSGLEEERERSGDIFRLF